MKNPTDRTITLMPITDDIDLDMGFRYELRVTRHDSQGGSFTDVVSLTAGETSALFTACLDCPSWPTDTEIDA